MTRLIFGTFNALTKLADLSEVEESATKIEKASDETDTDGAKQPPPEKTSPTALPKFNPEFRFNIEIHLPSNGTEETYLAIFNALRRSLG